MNSLTAFAARILRFDLWGIGRRATDMGSYKELVTAGFLPSISK